MFEIEDRILVESLGDLAGNYHAFAVTLWGKEVYTRGYDKKNYDSYADALDKFKDDFTKRLSTALDRGIWL